ncbi:MAG: hypothetical protein HOF45_05670 [Candidatus Marinimicrobia bacterium]|jgi:hypothetical protein|nr:hypothetical protein [Candidatus Neomarinimicrobiota bacterium]MBT3962084.1 hypothetical protein [Candidatus Neomarinimicrobiota bacterium]MBT4636569.1 hypothetical protein [Candidatus Neomarinimicrobiota bacterium]MBT4684606.1 hypothetical protein [Candidatus Neomarinimicrobiota bacterium]MBT5068823.1 hypothetical protein [Candidatus Neomarinimicrobiota bacterium]
MRKFKGIIYLPMSVIVLSLSWQCAENTIDNDLNHVGLNLDTLTVYTVNGSSYQTPPEIGTLKYLYYGSDSTYNIDYNLFTIKDRATNGQYWSTFLDTNIQVDSMALLLTSNDSSQLINYISNIGFSFEFSFDEYADNYTTLDTSLSEWTQLGSPTIEVVNDTSNFYEQTNYKLDISQLTTTLTDTTDSNLVRSFKMITSSSVDSIYRTYSRNYSNGILGPRIVVHYTLTTTTDDTTTIDTLESTFISDSDLSVLAGNQDDESVSYSEWLVGSGSGYKSVMVFDYDSLDLPQNSLIRSANLYFYASNSVTGGYNINAYAINIDTTIVGQWFPEDPFTGNASFISSASYVNDMFKFSMKNFLQNITLGNVSNYGIILKSNDSNDPFITVEIDSDNHVNDTRLEILYETP